MLSIIRLPNIESPLRPCKYVRLGKYVYTDLNIKAGSTRWAQFNKSTLFRDELQFKLTKRSLALRDASDGEISDLAFLILKKLK